MMLEEKIKMKVHMIVLLFSFSILNQNMVKGNSLAVLNVDAKSGRKMADNLFGVFFEEINHAGAGGLWAELVSNRGFEAGGQNNSDFAPWTVIGNETSINLATDLSSCFARNKVALRMEVLCDTSGSNICPAGGVGVYNPGYWGMNIEQGKTYNVILYVKSNDSVSFSVSLASMDGLQVLATNNITAPASTVGNWTKMEFLLEAKASNTMARLQFTTDKKGVIWFDQISVMPTDTNKGHGFRKDIYSMIANLNPAFVRFPGGSYIEGKTLVNAFKWKESIGPWEERPGHYNDIWGYWTEDGLGYYELLILIEDLGASPIWVFNIGMSTEENIVNPSNALTFVQDALDGIEFAIGAPNTTWGSVRAKMGHSDPFNVKIVAVGNENCFPNNQKNYEIIYPYFYKAIRSAYPNLKIISNCDGSRTPLNHPADFYDFHTYKEPPEMFNDNKCFDIAPRNGPKAFVSEYAAFGTLAGNGNFEDALSEAAFLIGLERNSDIVDMACYAPLFANINNQAWKPNSVYFDSSHHYGTPSYWVQYLFKESSGATFLNSALQTNSSIQVVASAVITHISNVDILKLKVVNFGDDTVNLDISVSGLDKTVNSLGSNMIILSSPNLMDENTFQEPNKVVPKQNNLTNASSTMDVVISPYSFTLFNLMLDQNSVGENTSHNFNEKPSIILLLLAIYLSSYFNQSIIILHIGDSSLKNSESTSHQH